MELWEAADKFSILRVKKEKGLDVDGHFKRYAEATDKIPPVLMEKLYEINKAMFDMEDLISFAFDWNDFTMAGHLYYVLRGMTHMRTAAKHKVAEWAKESLEVKKYGNGY